MKTLNFKYLLLSLIVLLGGFLRIYDLSGIPPSLNWDEAALGYNAYSISETFRDEYKTFLPLYTRSFDDYKSAIPIYLIIPSIKVFGLNEVGVRFPSALLGTLSILLVYLISKRIFGNERVSLVSAFVFAIEPWSVHFSRVLHEANIALFFLILGFLLFSYSKEKWYFLPLSITSFMLSMYTYHANKILVPIFLGVLIFLSKDRLLKISRKWLISSGVILSLLVVLFIVLAFIGQTFARVGATNIFILWNNIPDSFGNWLDFLAHNQFFYFTWEVAGRYFSYFSPYNLFIREPQEPVTIVAGSSIFYPFEFIPLFVGLAYILKNLRSYKELSVLLLLSPLPAIVTWNWFQPARAMSLFAVFSILIGLGVVLIIKSISQFLKKFLPVSLTEKGFFFAFALYGSVSAFYLFDSINVFLPTRDPGNWQPGFRETVPLVMGIANDYEQVIIETPHAQPYIFYLFYGKYPPGKYLKEVDFDYIGTPRKHYDFGKFKFRKIYWPEDRSLKNTLFVGSEQNLPQKDINDTLGAKVIAEPKDRWGNVIHKLVGIE